jgi:DNA-binding transcriptional LysR family regulator
MSKELQLRPFAQDSVTVVAARRTPVASSPGIVELGLHPWILNPRGCGFRAALDRTLDREGGHLNLCAQVQGYDLQLSLIARGAGLGLVPKARWQASPYRKQLKPIEPHDFQLFVTSAIVTRGGRERFGQVVDLLASTMKQVAQRQNAQLA